MARVLTKAICPSPSLSLSLSPFSFLPIIVFFVFFTKKVFVFKIPSETCDSKGRGSKERMRKHTLALDLGGVAAVAGQAGRPRDILERRQRSCR